MEELNLQLITKKLSGELSEQESKAFDAWLNSHPVNSNHFKTLEKAWIVSGELYPEYTPNTNTEWGKLKAKIGITAVTKVKTAHYTRVKRIRIAAAIVLLIMLGLAIKFRYANDKALSPDKVVTTQPLQIAEVVATNTVLTFYLPDSTKLILNKKSTLSFAKDFTDAVRSVRLSGEAYFEVRKTGKPFIVYTEGTEINVTGTEFDVKAHKKDEVIQVAVFKGEVLFKEQGSSSVFTLKTNDKLEFNKKDKKIKHSKNENKNSWSKEFKSNTKLDRAVNRLFNKVEKGIGKIN